MSRKPVAREKLLTAFEHLVLAEGLRSATLDAVAARAGVSKGGLLYHFPHRQALVDAALARCEELAAADLARLTASPHGAAREFLATSLYEDSPLDRSLGVAFRLVQAREPGARATCERVADGWYRAVLEDVQDPVIATAVQAMGDGLYQQASMGLLPDGESEKQEVLARLLDAVDRLHRTAPDDAAPASRTCERGHGFTPATAS
ncbi:TetR/AcrR family transcriptional regulator [Kocuria tytonis]|uniref:TetR/AcrR family transcriptional regulator n=1 Tax=Kocuria tytonis TaxID=2054280 RepID=A0A495A9V7_9MICC|nr:TetR/AcrR family transcriptional regulator [Kocuria tytonis]RKQ35327.1 TetR/AcrR family transcriptional regulator [Kocuria tytonis]